MNNERVFIAGHRGLVGSALVRALTNKCELITRPHSQLDLLDQQAVDKFLVETKPTIIIIAAARVGGIIANNTYRAEFIYENLMIAANLIHAAWKNKIPKLLFLGSSCIYPKNCLQPMKEEYLLTGPLEQTNEPYAVAKIAGLKMVESYNRQYKTNFLSVMPTNLYGPNDNFDLTSSHVLPAMIRKFHDAKVAGDKPVLLWGTGSPKREFLHVDDMANACLHVLDNVKIGQFPNDVINIGCGEDVSTYDLAHLIQKIVGHKGAIEWDTSKPDGTPRKLQDISRLKQLGWAPKISLVQGIEETYSWYKQSLG